jgi:hypothetical protein
MGKFLKVAMAHAVAAVKDRRRDQRATTTSRELVLARNRRRCKRVRLIGFPADLACVDGDAPSGMFSGMATTRDLAIPDVTDGVAQDRKRQEP